MTWSAGALHYSDEVILVKELTEDYEDLKRKIDGISYIGKGTHTDCAIRSGVGELSIG